MSGGATRLCSTDAFFSNMFPGFTTRTHVGMYLFVFICIYLLLPYVLFYVILIQSLSTTTTTTTTTTSYPVTKFDR